MIISINDVPPYERHFLFSTDPRLSANTEPLPVEEDELAPVNRSLAIHGEFVDELIPLPVCGGFAPGRPVVGVA